MFFFPIYLQHNLVFIRRYDRKVIIGWLIATTLLFYIFSWATMFLTVTAELSYSRIISRKHNPKSSTSSNYNCNKTLTAVESESPVLQGVKPWLSFVVMMNGAAMTADR